MSLPASPALFYQLLTSIVFTCKQMFLVNGFSCSLSWINVCDLFLMNFSCDLFLIKYCQVLSLDCPISSDSLSQFSCYFTFCRSFTPVLADWYKTFKKTANGDKFNIVFVSSDRQEYEFNDYFEQMPWLALPFERRDVKVC